MEPGEDDARAIEDGRLLFAQACDFLVSAAEHDDLLLEQHPFDDPAEGHHDPHGGEVGNRGKVPRPNGLGVLFPGLTTVKSLLVYRLE